MSPSEFAVKITGREYGSELTKDEEYEAKRAGLVVVTGYSDDNVEFRGAINDEFGCYGGGTVALDENGLLEMCESECKYFQAAEEKAAHVTGHWNIDGYSWVISSDDVGMDAGTFIVLEDGLPFCKGLVFRLSALREALPNDLGSGVVAEPMPSLAEQRQRLRGSE